MSPCTALESWLACPTTTGQTDAYWQAVQAWREAGFELVLHPGPHAAPLPWHRLRHERPWLGLVLWPDGGGPQLWQEACQHGVQVRCLAPDPLLGLQLWSGA